MFGISWTEFIVILLVAICVVPAKYWPDVAKFFARVVKYIRKIIWQISDFSEEVQKRIDLEKPIDDLLQNATDDMFGTKVSKTKKNPVKKVRKK
jgi:Sec-independent protein translocase protein TatA